MLNTYRNIYLFCADQQVKKSVQEFIKEVYSNEFYITNDFDKFIKNPFCYVLVPTENDLGKSIREQVIHIREYEISKLSEYFCPIIVIKNTLSFFNYIRSPFYFNIDICELKEKINLLKDKPLHDYKIVVYDKAEIDTFKKFCIKFYNHDLERNDKIVTANFFKIYQKYFTEEEKNYFTETNLIQNNSL